MKNLISVSTKPAAGHGKPFRKLVDDPFTHVKQFEWTHAMLRPIEMAQATSKLSVDGAPEPPTER